MRDFKIGEEIKVKSWEELVEEFNKGKEIGEGFYCGEVYFAIEMKPLCGKVLTVAEDNLRYNEIEVEFKKEVWTITTDMVHFLNDCELENSLELEEINVKPQLKIKKLREDAIIPTYATDGDSGLDLYTLDDCIIKAGATVVIPTGIAIGLPPKHEGQVRPRSGISLKGCKGCKTICNFPYVDSYGKLQTEVNIGLDFQAYLRVQLGTVDNPYSGDVGIITYNQEQFDIFIPAKTKLAQLVVSPVTYVRTELVEGLAETERGSKGFGSTGV